MNMVLAFRFHPGLDNFLLNNFNFPVSFSRLSFLSDTLGLYYSRTPLALNSVSPFCSSGVGFRDMVDHKLTKILVEIITHYNGFYGRFFVLVTLGLSCIVWFGFESGNNEVPNYGVFTPFDSYDPFLNMEYYEPPGFTRLSFVEKKDISEMIESVLDNELPFTDIEMIPASGHVLKAVGLGIMLTTFILLGLIPNTNVPVADQLIIG